MLIVDIWHKAANFGKTPIVREMSHLIPATVTSIATIGNIEMAYNFAKDMAVHRLIDPCAPIAAITEIELTGLLLVNGLSSVMAATYARANGAKTLPTVTMGLFGFGAISMGCRYARAALQDAPHVPLASCPTNIGNFALSILAGYFVASAIGTTIATYNLTRPSEGRPSSPRLQKPQQH
ncbi:MAG: hypothetical protein P4M15_06210 [Alphaproteobacteria bacterium]|nr:hypothetical protein [Alphaproteobacteria bacterium]